jgi:hypothetical protein
MPLTRVAALVAVVIVATSVASAFAAQSMINGNRLKAGTVSSTQLKNNDVRGIDVRAGAITETDLAPAVKTKLAVTGPAGAAGATGARGFSAWDTIPSGVTVTGELRWDEDKTINLLDQRNLYVQLPAVAPIALTDATVNFAPGATHDIDASCAGTATAPTAPAGKVCIYRASGSFYVTSAIGHPGTLANRGFFVSIITDVEIDPSFVATWAYTAP